MKFKKNFTTGLIFGIFGVLLPILIIGMTSTEINNNYKSAQVDEDRIIERILFCLDGSSITLTDYNGNDYSGSLSTYCNR